MEGVQAWRKAAGSHTYGEETPMIQSEISSIMPYILFSQPSATGTFQTNYVYIVFSAVHVGQIG